MIEHQLATVDSSPLSISPVLTPRDSNSHMSQHDDGTCISLMTDCGSQRSITDETSDILTCDHVDVYLIPGNDGNAATLAPTVKNATDVESNTVILPVTGISDQLQSPGSSTDIDINDQSGDLLISQSLTLSGGITSEEMPGIDQVNDRTEQCL